MFNSAYKSALRGQDYTVFHILRRAVANIHEVMNLVESTNVDVRAREQVSRLIKQLFVSFMT